MPEPFDRLDAYRSAINLVGQVRPLVLRLRRREDAMADQLHRAVLSVACNTAEGAGEFSAGDKARLYRYALRSAAEATAILDAARAINMMEAAEHQTCRDTSVRLVAMLTRLVLVTSARAERRSPNPKKSPR
ncbi:MAG TPA: four helix bundle protein [Longimicrobiales bacterium]|nr:four helix bundle protein [Longimicrobiales bacterium]